MKQASFSLMGTNMNFREWIDEKTPEKLHLVLDVPHGTIRTWKHRNMIPRDQWPELLTKVRGVKICDLLRMEAASK